MENEPNIVESIVSGVDVVSFSGDKLLGGLQSGIIVGKAHLIDKIRRNPMYRALRVDKLVYSCLEATLESFADGTEISDLPVLRMLSESKESLQSRCKTFIDEHLKNEQEYLEIIDEASVIGGGTTPGEYLPSVVVALKSENSTPNQIEERLRLSDVPVISRISNDKVLIDLRTVFSDEEGSLANAIKNAVRGNQS
jgi:L-seryl-tRNA(Ser) seleniumtransferase